MMLLSKQIVYKKTQICTCISLNSVVAYSTNCKKLKRFTTGDSIFDNYKYLALYHTPLNSKPLMHTYKVKFLPTLDYLREIYPGLTNNVTIFYTNDKLEFDKFIHKYSQSLHIMIVFIEKQYICCDFNRLNINSFNNNIITIFTSDNENLFNWFSIINEISNIKVIGQTLFTNYAFYFILAGFVLLIGIMGSIILSRRTNKNIRRYQLVYQQLSRNIENAVFLID
ncbi:hypothetical protein WA158_002599 [Blastocystis sp. Blastoise]